MPTGGTPLLPVTKTGPGDKQRAYIVRQNLCLKVALGLVVLIGTLGTALLMTKYEVHLQKRHELHEARTHREEEHASHMRVLRLSMVLQRHLEDEVHDLSVLTTYRAWLMRAVGDYQKDVLGITEKSNCSRTDLPEALRGRGMDFDKNIESLLKRLWDEVVSEGKAAQKALHNITHAIVSELSQDASEQGAFEQIMRDAGEDPGMLGYRNHEVERLDGKRAWDDEYHGHEDPDRADYHHEEDAEYRHDEAGHDEDDERDDDDEEHLAGALEALAKRLAHEESVVYVDNATLEEWGELHDTSMQALQDEEQEVDMDRINGKIANAMKHAHFFGNSTVPAYNATEFSSELDYLTAMIHRARLAQYRCAPPAHARHVLPVAPSRCQSRAHRRRGSRRAPSAADHRVPCPKRAQ